MQLNSNVSKLQKSLEQFAVDNQRKLEHMVAMFAVELASAASSKTPVGSDEAIRTVDRYAGSYAARMEQYGIPMEAGFHAGSWQYAENQQLDFVPVIYEQADVLNDVLYSAESAYKLGDNFNIGSIAPAIVQLENNYSKQTQGRGIVAPTLEQVKAAFAVDSQINYNNG